MPYLIQMPAWKRVGIVMEDTEFVWLTNITKGYLHAKQRQHKLPGMLLFEMSSRFLHVGISSHEVIILIYCREGDWERLSLCPVASTTYHMQEIYQEPVIKTGGPANYHSVSYINMSHLELVQLPSFKVVCLVVNFYNGRDSTIAVQLQKDTSICTGIADVTCPHPD